MPRVARHNSVQVYGPAIEGLRRRAGLTQAELIKRVEGAGGQLSRQHLSRIETSREPPHIHRRQAEALANTLGVELPDLAPPPVLLPPTTPQGARLVRRSPNRLQGAEPAGARRRRSPTPGQQLDALLVELDVKEDEAQELGASLLPLTRSIVRFARWSGQGRSLRAHPGAAADSVPGTVTSGPPPLPQSQSQFALRVSVVRASDSDQAGDSPDVVREFLSGYAITVMLPGGAGTISCETDEWGEAVFPDLPLETLTGPEAVVAVQVCAPGSPAEDHES